MSVESEFYASTIAVLSEQLRLIMELSLQMANRLDELDDQLQIASAQEEDKEHSSTYMDGYDAGRDDAEFIQSFWEDDEPVYPFRKNGTCTCPECNEDRSYRMN